MHITTSFYDFCPEQNDFQEIEVFFTEVPILGQSAPQYKKTGFHCDFCDSHECNTIASHDTCCPLFMKCPEP